MLFLMKKKINKLLTAFLGRETKLNQKEKRNKCPASSRHRDFDLELLTSKTFLHTGTDIF